MNRRRTTLVVALASIVAVLAIAMVDFRRESPGPVAAVHAQLAAIAGGEACAACHGGWFGDMQAACLDCHAPIRDQLAATRGVHGSLPPARAADCSACHGEHHGDGFRLVNRLAFAQAGLGDPNRFDHDKVGFALVGGHEALACKQCHPAADVDVLAEGQRRYLGQSTDCATCHQSPHGNRMQVACATCHDETAFHAQRVVDHDRHLPLTGVHAQVGCRECHGEGTRRGLEAITPEPTAPDRTCADCHESPHRQELVTATAAAAGLAAGAACTACHAVDALGFGLAGDTMTAAAHARTGFPLTAPHAKVGCDDCHQPGRPYAARFPGRAADDCARCHRDPHDGQFTAGPFAAGCIACHDRSGFAPHAFDAAHHARTRLQLDGAHAELACSACHADPAPGTPRRFADTPFRCEQCHTDAHRGHLVAAATPPAAGTCAECHRSTAFADVDTARFAHGERTAFPLAGAHAEADCAACHAPTVAADADHRRFGHAVPPDQPFTGCAQCHADVHRGVFDQAPAPAELDGRTGCERCHDAASFRVLPHGFAHDRFTGFALAGRHAELACTQCHPIEPKSGARQPAKGDTCAACHADVHQGQFERLGATDCARCHKSATAFAVVTFRHNVQSRFPLDAQHEHVACAGCHRTETIHGAPAVRYKPLPTECVDCHGDRQGPGERKRKA